MILRTLFASIRMPEQLDAALRAYDDVRRPRTQRIVEGWITLDKIEIGMSFYTAKNRIYQKDVREM